MSRSMIALVLLAAAPLAATAHMVYLVPSADGKSLTVVFSDTLEPDEKVKMTKVAGLKLVGQPAEGRPAALELTKGDHKFTAALAAGTKAASGEVTYGLMTKAEKPTLLVYHPKAVLGGPDGPTGAALEAVAVTAGGKTRFRLLAGGKPVAGAAGGVLLPDGGQEKVTTDKDGYTAAFAGAGRYAVWLRRTEAKAGEHGGKAYEEVRRYATLVIDVAK